jgi:hypothetical protein
MALKSAPEEQLLKIHRHDFENSLQTLILNLYKEPTILTMPEETHHKSQPKLVPIPT